MNRLKWKRGVVDGVYQYYSDDRRFVIAQKFPVVFIHGLYGNESGGIVQKTHPSLWLANIHPEPFLSIYAAKMACEDRANCWGYYWHASTGKARRGLPSYVGAKVKLFDTEEEAERYGMVAMLKES